MAVAAAEVERQPLTPHRRPPLQAPAQPQAPAGTGAGRGAAGGAQSATDLQNADGPAPVVSAKGGLTALHHAVRQGHIPAALALLEGGADVNQKSGEGHTPLLIAIINGQFDLAMMLVERRANPNLSAENLGVTPLWAAVNAQWQPRTRFPQPQEMDLQKSTYLDVMKAMLEAGADPNARVRVHPYYMVYTGCGNGNCGLTSVVGSTAFWRAAYGTDVEAMKLLVKYGADPNIPTMAAAGRGGGAGARGGGGGAAAAGRGGAGRGGGGPDASAPADAAQAARRPPRSIRQACRLCQLAVPASSRFMPHRASSTARASPATRTGMRRTAGSPA